MFDDSCFDCESIDINYRFIKTDENGNKVYECVCRECGASWNDWEEGLDDG